MEDLLQRPWPGEARLFPTQVYHRRQDRYESRAGGQRSTEFARVVQIVKDLFRGEERTKASIRTKWLRWEPRFREACWAEK